MGLIQAAVVVIVTALVLGHKSSELKSRMVLNVNANADEVGAAVGTLVFEKSKEAIASRGRFTLALSGGSLPKVRGANNLMTSSAGIQRGCMLIHVDGDGLLL